ncbi:hypothetical protein FXO38_08979 [Capsicum annuum]|nr:hypothetical protein FXO37_20322 [Capsicum annuum]KAF3666663.1 hypothetical protein FXO38_08979 [Capsicum annuum]
MEAYTASEIYVFPQICNAKRSPPGPAISGNNFNMEISLLAKHVHTCGDNIVQECHFENRCCYKYKSLSWDIVDRELSASDFPYPLENVKWNGADRILENKDDLIQQILEFARALQNVTPPFQDDDTVCVGLIFVKHVEYVYPQEFERTNARIIAKYYENIEEMLWGKVRNEIKGLGHGSSLYEEFQRLPCCVEKIVRETTHWSMGFDESYEMVLTQSLTEGARREFMSLPAVRSIMQYVRRVHLSENELKNKCPICMDSYSPGSEAYNIPCNHNFHFGCIETWLLKNPSCPMCRYKLSPMEMK